MKIKITEPAHWKELQNNVAEILNECGYETLVEKTIQTVRGNVTIDCFAEKQNGHRTIIFAECKFWSKRIPQSIVHSFRTVVNDSGANSGFIISKAGFQKGAIDAVENSNITLMTYNEFLERHQMEWLNFVIARNFEIGQELLPYTQFDFVPKELSELDENNKVEFYKILELSKKDCIDFLTLKEHYYALPKHVISLDEVDKRIQEYRKRLPIEVTCYSDYFSYIYKYCSDILNQIDSLFNKKIRRNLFDFEQK